MIVWRARRSIAICIAACLTVALVAGCASSQNQTTAAESDAPVANAVGKPLPGDPKVAQATLGMLDAWKLYPKVILDECSAFDGAGRTQRQELYEAWRLRNQSRLEEVDLDLSTLIPKLSPQIVAQGLDPVKAVEANTKIQLSYSAHFASDADKRNMCSGYDGMLKRFDDPLDAKLRQAFIDAAAWRASSP